MKRTIFARSLSEARGKMLEFSGDPIRIEIWSKELARAGFVIVNQGNIETTIRLDNWRKEPKGAQSRGNRVSDDRHRHRRPHGERDWDGSRLQEG